MKRIEDRLDIPFKELLQIIQDRIVSNTFYWGIPAAKNPMDYWVYQEIIFELKPDVIIEIGNYHGGSTLALAHILDRLEKGRVIGIDIDHTLVPEEVASHPRITLITGDAGDVFDEVSRMTGHDDKVLVIEDSSHTYENTLQVLEKYSTLVTKGSYFIVEDGICHHGLDVGPNPGPYEAIEEFMRDNNSFKIDRERESFFVTWNPKGFLKKLSDQDA